MIEFCSSTLVVFLLPFSNERPTNCRAIFSDIAQYFLYADPSLFIPSLSFIFFSLFPSHHAGYGCSREYYFHITIMHHAAMQPFYSRVAAKDTLPPEAAAAAAASSTRPSNSGSGSDGSADVNSIAIGGAKDVVDGQSLPTP